MGERNGSWVVSITKWIIDENGFPVVTLCKGKCFRREEYAKELYEDVIADSERYGYVMSPLKKPRDTLEYEGMQGVAMSKRYGNDYICVFIDHNRSY